MEKKRAVLLLRVSTAKQAEDNEECPIPLQKERCEAYCNENGWEIVDTIFESKSGYKNSINDREAIMLLNKHISERVFDVLVVFKLDRIGRTGIETTGFIVSVLKSGVEIYSVTEGKISIENSENELMLMMKGWLAQQESKNTSVRVKSAMEALVVSGGYRGGRPMFGYRLVPTGVVNRKGRMINELWVDEREAELVRQLFRLTVEEGRGTTQLAGYLNSMGVTTHNGARFQANNIMRILKNRIYIGHLDTEKIEGPYQERLRIIDDETFYKVQEILGQRRTKSNEKRIISLTTRGESLLSGNVFCGHCGGRITVSASSSYYTLNSGERHRYETRKYICGNRANRRYGCKGLTAYKTKLIDEKINEIVISVLGKIEHSPQEELVMKTYETRLKELKQSEKELKGELELLEKKQKKLTLEIGNAVIGESVFTTEQLKESLDTVNSEKGEKEKKLKECESRLNNLCAEKEAAEGGYSKLTGWAEEYENATLERKRMIIFEIFDRIELSEGYKIKVVMNEVYRVFLEGNGENIKDLKQ